jgi:hypothetical protein
MIEKLRNQSYASKVGARGWDNLNNIIENYQNARFFIGRERDYDGRFNIRFPSNRGIAWNPLVTLDFHGTQFRNRVLGNQNKWTSKKNFFPTYPLILTHHKHTISICRTIIPILVLPERISEREHFVIPCYAR